MAKAASHKDSHIVIRALKPVPLVLSLLTSHQSHLSQETMRIKIIGDNNCARATRHLLRMAGFAVTEFLPVEAITHAPHSGYAITIDLAPAAHPLNPSGKISGGFPTSAPDQATHEQSALGEVSSSVGGASSRLSVQRSGELGEAAEANAMAGTATGARKVTQTVTHTEPFVRSETAARKGRQAEA